MFIKAVLLALFLTTLAGSAEYATAKVQDSSPWGGPITPPTRGIFVGGKDEGDAIEIESRRPAKRRDELLALINEDSVHSCFVALPGNDGSGFVPIAGYGRSRQFFEEFDRKFKAQTGFETLIEFRPISSQQCSVLDALRKFSHQGMSIEEFFLLFQGGSTINGHTRMTSEYVEVLHIDSIGMIQRSRKIIHDFIHEGILGDKIVADVGYRFVLNLETHGDESVCSSNFVLAFFSHKSLTDLSFDASTQASKLLPVLVQELAKRSDVTLEIGYVRDRNTEEHCFISTPNTEP